MVNARIVDFIIIMTYEQWYRTTGVVFGDNIYALYTHMRVVNIYTILHQRTNIFFF